MVPVRAAGSDEGIDEDPDSGQQQGKEPKQQVQDGSRDSFDQRQTPWTVFDGRVPVPVQVPGRRYEETADQPWYNMEN